MADTARTRAELVTLFADNTSGDISAQDGRDLMASFMPASGYFRSTTAYNFDLPIDFPKIDIPSAPAANHVLIFLAEQPGFPGSLGVFAKFPTGDPVLMANGP